MMRLAPLVRGSSLLRQLLMPLVGLWLVSAALATMSAFWLAGRTADAALDRILSDDALALAGQVRWDGSVPVFVGDLATAASLVFDSVSPSLFTVRIDGGATLIGNADLALPGDSADAVAGKPLFYDGTTARSRPLRVVALRLRAPAGQPGVWVIVGESLAKRDQVIHTLALAIFTPTVVLAFVSLPLLYLGVRRGLAPTAATALAVASRGLDDLAPLALERVPDELRPLVGQINTMLERLQAAVTRERNFVAEAAHQLRTPVAGLKLLSDGLWRDRHAHPRRPPDAEVVDELHAAAARAAHLVQQLLALERANRLDQVSGTEAERFDLVALVRAVAQGQQERAADAGKTLHLSLPAGALWLAGPAFLLQEALLNVIDNALLYGGSVIALELTRVNRQALLSVLDDGPVLAPQVIERMLVPFWRGSEAVAAGSGLGLSIAEKTARRLGGELRVASRPQAPGTRITFRLPLPASVKRT